MDARRPRRVATMSFARAGAGDAPRRARPVFRRGRVLDKPRPQPGAALTRPTTTSATARRSTSAPSPSSGARPILRGSRGPRSGSRCASSTPAAWSKRPDDIVFTPGAVDAAIGGACPRRADLLRRPHGRGRRDARPPAGRQRRDLHARRSGHPGARRVARHDPDGRRDRPLARQARRRRRGHRQCADGAVPPARTHRRPARRGRLRSSACRSASSAPPNRRKRCSRRRLPALMVRGRKGGSAMAAAAVNALASAKE